MANVTFEVQSRVIHPDTKQPIVSYGADYEPYNAIIEKTNASAKPDGITATWPINSGITDVNNIERNILITAFSTAVGNALTGYEQNHKYLDALMNDQTVVTLIQDVQLLKTEIADLVSRINADTQSREAVVKAIKRDHNGAYFDYATGTVSGDYYTHNPVQGFITVTGCKSNAAGTTPTFGPSYAFIHSDQCNENVRLFAQYCSRIQTDTTSKTAKQSTLVTKNNDLIKKIQNFVVLAETDFVAARNALVDNSLYNMLFVFKGTKKVFSRNYPNVYTYTPPGGGTTVVTKMNMEVTMDTFDTIRGNIWSTSSIWDSEQAAQKSAAKLIGVIGKENVRIVKVVPLDTKVTIEGSNN